MPFNNELTKQSKQVVERLKHIKPGQNAFTADLPEELQLKVKGAKISQIYKRLDPSKPSYTVTGSGGGGTHIYHWQNLVLSLIVNAHVCKHFPILISSLVPRKVSGSK